MFCQFRYLNPKNPSSDRKIRNDKLIECASTKTCISGRVGRTIFRFKTAIHKNELSEQNIAEEFDTTSNDILENQGKVWAARDILLQGIAATKHLSRGKSEMRPCARQIPLTCMQDELRLIQLMLK